MGRKSRAKVVRRLQPVAPPEIVAEVSRVVVSPEDIARRLREADRRLRWERRRIAVLVVEGRAQGMSWGVIAAALGISRQAAQQRFSGC
jgi:hypothetical protein